MNGYGMGASTKTQSIQRLKQLQAKQLLQQRTQFQVPPDSGISQKMIKAGLIIAGVSLIVYIVSSTGVLGKLFGGSGSGSKAKRTR